MKNNRIFMQCFVYVRVCIVCLLCITVCKSVCVLCVCFQYMLVFLYNVIVSVCICAITNTNISFHHHQCDYANIEINIIAHIIYQTLSKTHTLNNTCQLTIMDQRKCTKELCKKKQSQSDPKQPCVDRNYIIFLIFLILFSLSTQLNGH